MASAYSYTFDNQSRIGNDPCGISEREMQNNNYGSYLTQNFYLQNCGMRKPIEFATSQPSVFYKGTHLGMGGCNVDSDSNLKIGSIQTNPKCRISLQQRPFLTVPFLGKGPAKPEVESKMLQGGYLGEKKSCKSVMEKSLREEPLELVPSLKATIQNPANICEDIAAEGWIRGGLPSREMSRNQDYFKRN